MWDEMYSNIIKLNWFVRSSILKDRGFSRAYNKQKNTLFFPLNNRIISMQFIFKGIFKKSLLGSYSGNFFRVCYSYLFQGY